MISSPRFLALLVALVPAIAHSWPVYLDGPAHESDYCRGPLAVAANGDAIASTLIYGLDERIEGSVGRYAAADGAEVWRYVLPGGPLPYEEFLGRDTVRAVGLDAAGDVYLAGEIISPTTEGMNLAIAKLAGSTGAPIWEDFIDAAGANALALDADGPHAPSVFVAGSIAGATAGDSDFVVLRVSAADGTEQWRTIFNGSVPVPPGGVYPVSGDAAYAIAVDPSGDVIAAGAVSDWVSGALTDALVVKLGQADGAELWRWQAAGTADGPFKQNQVTHLAVDASGDVYATAAFFDAQIDLVVVKIDGATGAELWRKTFADGRFGRLTLSADGKLYVATAIAGEINVLRLSPADGDETWRTPIGAGNPVRVRVAPDGSPVVFGTLSATSIGVAKLDAATGDIVWTRSYGPTGGQAQGFGGDIDAAGDVIAVGRTIDPVLDQGEDGILLKLDGITGEIVGCGDGVVDAGEECDDGNTTHADACDRACRIPLCLSHVGVLSPKVMLRKLTGVSGDESLTARGSLSFPVGQPAGYDPAATGVQLRFETPAGLETIVDFTYRTASVPPATAGVCGPYDGWSVRGTTATYRNRSGAFPPACAPGSAHGLVKLALADRRATRNRIELKAVIAHTALSVFERHHAVAVRATVVLDGAATAGVEGRCAAVDVSCKDSGNGATLICASP